MLHQIKEYNNAGVLCMESGMTRHAWVFFKGALELHLACEKSKANPPLRGVSPTAATYIQHAAVRYQQLVSMNLQAFCSDSDNDATVYHHACHVALLQTPRLILNSQEQDATAMGVTIIFNLALVEHWKDPSSEQVLCMYGLGYSLLDPQQHQDDDDNHNLQAAILNNMAIWYFCNGNVALAESCLARVKKLSKLEQGTKDQIHSNWCWIITQQYHTSPAA